MSRILSMSLLPLMLRMADDGGSAGAAVAETAEVAAVPGTAEKPLIVMKETSFFFKKDDLGNKRPTIKLNLPILTIDGLIEKLADAKVQELVLSLLEDEVVRNARVQVNDEQKPVNTQEELDMSKLDVVYIANLPKAERTGGGISKETWEKFSKDYIEVMPAATGKNLEAVSNAAKLLVGKFQPVKTNKPVIQFLKTQLALYTTVTQNLEEFSECVEFLDKKADTLLAADEQALLANL